MAIILKGSGVTQLFGGLKALDEVDFQLNRGEVLGVIGPNGAGKTTLFSVISGAIAPTRGRVIFNDRVISGRKSYWVVHAGVCRTHQIVRPFSKISVLENVLIGVYFGESRFGRSTRSVEKTALDLVDFVGLGGREHDVPAALTLSDRKRLEVARALATAPDVLLLDEVIAGLSPAEAIEMVELIKKIRSSSVSIMMIEHVMQAVMAVSDRILVLDHGKKIAEGLPEQVVRNSQVIEAYLGMSEDTKSLSSRSIN